MSSQQDILQALQRNLPEQKVACPEIPSFAGDALDLPALFKERLAVAAGTCFTVDSVAAARQIMLDKLPEARIIASAAPEWPGTVDLAAATRPHDLENVDIGIVRAEFGVAEIGCVWLTEKSLVVNAIGFLSQHLVILLDPKEICENLHTAYQRVKLADQHYGCFMMGPSATADIGATLVHGAQGARSLTVFLLPEE